MCLFQNLLGPTEFLPWLSMGFSSGQLLMDTCNWKYLYYTELLLHGRKQQEWNYVEPILLMWWLLRICVAVYSTLSWALFCLALLPARRSLDQLKGEYELIRNMALANGSFEKFLVGVSWSTQLQLRWMGLQSHIKNQKFNRILLLGSLLCSVYEWFCFISRCHLMSEMDIV